MSPAPSRSSVSVVPEEEAAPAYDKAVAERVALAEFNKLRDEIAGRSSAAWTLVGLNATASSAVAGFVLSAKADARLLLLLPLLTPCLGLLFIDHATNIGRIGEYINTVLKPLLRTISGEATLLGYEEWVNAYEAIRVRRILPFGIPLVLFFNIVPVAALAYSATRIDTPWSWTLWAMGVVTTVVEVGFWIAFLAPPLRRAITASE